MGHQTVAALLSAEPEDATPQTRQIREGVRVVLVGLGRTDFNGQYGIVEGYDSTAERYLIHMEDSPEASVKVKYKNIQTTVPTSITPAPPDLSQNSNMQVVPTSVTPALPELSQCNQPPDVFTRVGIRLAGQTEIVLIPIYDCATTGIVQWAPTSADADQMQCALCAAGRRQSMSSGGGRKSGQNSRKATVSKKRKGDMRKHNSHTPFHYECITKHQSCDGLIRKHLEANHGSGTLEYEVVPLVDLPFAQSLNKCTRWLLTASSLTTQSLSHTILSSRWSQRRRRRPQHQLFRLLEPMQRLLQLQRNQHPLLVLWFNHSRRHAQVECT